MNRTFTRKLIAAIMVFMMLFSHSAFTMEAIASSGDFKVISVGLFSTDVIKYSVYPDGGTEKDDEIISDVNDHAFLTIDLNPKVDGYLRDGTIRAVDLEGNELGFRIVNVTAVSETKTETAVNVAETEEDVTRIDVEEMLEVQEEPEVVPEEPEPEPSSTVEEPTVVVPEKVENTVKNETVNTVTENTTANTTNAVETENTVNGVQKSTLKLETQGRKLTMETEQVVTSDVSGSFGILDEGKNFEPTEASLIATNDVVEEEEEPAVVAPNTEVEEGRLVDEEKLIESKSEQESIKDLSLTADVKVISDNEISLKNVISNTKLTVEIEFVQSEQMTTRDAFKEIAFQLSGTFINEDLKEVEVGKEEEIVIGWTQDQDIELSSEYTKVSPFEIGEEYGTIVESTINVKRESEENHLPIINTTINVDIPEFKGKLPTDITVYASKLLLTRGEDIGSVRFDITNWKVDGNKLTISVDNDNEGIHMVGNGEDEYVIVYRYEDYTEDITSRLGQNVTATVIQLNAKENSTYIKNVSQEQEIKIDANELVTYSVNSSEDKIEKAKIYANYNNDQGLYDTEYTTEVNVNVLTSDLLKELKIQDYKEYYKDVNGNLFRAEGIIYKRIKFNYSDLKNILSNGGGIEIYNQDGVLLYTLVNDLINDENDAVVEVNSLGGCYIVAKGIATNGRINFEITKAIINCNYEKAAFKNFTQMESVINAEIKYEGSDEAVKLESKRTSKMFDESYTKANVILNRPTLTTLQTNEDVEIKIELNNDKENSDLYVNPVFELVFPKYVKEVNVESINLLYSNGLTIGNVETFMDEGVIKLRVLLNGTQTSFSESNLSNGTNVLLNLNIRVDEFTPTKEDQIKLFYYNEGAANYQAQTKWKLDRIVPNGLLKTTNGFDVALIKYQAPSGLVAINNIINYDGNNSELGSVKKGKVTANIELNKDARVATMEVLVLNNTENECSDVVMIGRLPCIGSKTVINNEDLGTNVNAVMIEQLKEDVQNPNTSDIYYSNNIDATTELKDPANGWNKDPDNLNEVRSFMIIVKGNISEGIVQRYTYNFEIPSNLAYSTIIAGSFGAYYTEISEVGNMEQTSEADIVELRTVEGPQLEAVLAADVENGAEVKEGDYVNYKVTVKNTGGVDALGVHVALNTNQITWMEFKELGPSDITGYFPIAESTKYFNIDVLKSGEERTFEALGKVKTIPAYEDSSLLKETDLNTKCEAKITTSNLAFDVKSNTISNSIKRTDIVTNLSIDVFGHFLAKSTGSYFVSISNNSDGELENVSLQAVIPYPLKYQRCEVVGSKEGEYEIGVKGNVITIDNISLKKAESKSVLFELMPLTGTAEKICPDFTVTSNGETYKVYPVEIQIYGGSLVAELVSQPNTNIVLEDEEVEYVLQVKNLGNSVATEVKVNVDISQFLKDCSLVQRKTTSTETKTTKGSVEGTKGLITLMDISPNESITVTLKGKAKESDKEDEIFNNFYVNHLDEEVAMLQTNIIKIKTNPNKKVEEKKVIQKVSVTETAKNSGTTTIQNTTPAAETPKPSNNNTTNQNTSNKPIEQVVYAISGTTWLDENKDGVRDGEEKELSGIEVQLIYNGNMIKVTTTDSKGNYIFNSVPNGKYTILFNYDGATYVPTKYKKANVDEAFTSNVIEAKVGKAITNEIKVSGNDVGNINLGLQYKDTFDLAITKLATKGSITYGSKTEDYKFDDLQLAKLEIQSKKLKGSVVEITYKIIVENIGNVDGYASKIEDYIPDEMKFNPDKNPGWNLGTDGVLYNETLKDNIIKVGEKKELKLVLTKEMNEDNTGVSCNKIKISELNNEKGLADINENNVNTQETLILIKTGYTPQIAAVLVFILLASTVVGIKYKDEISSIFKKKVIK